MRSLMRIPLLLFFCGLVLAGLSRSLIAQTDDRFVALFASCAACHGADGAGVMPGAPALGGQNEPYLLEVLRTLQGKQGHSAIMRGATTDLTDDDLQQLARYFASLPYQRTAQSVAPERVARGDAIYKRVCNHCHLGSGRASIYENVPLLAGQNLDYMLNELDHIVNSRRHVEITKRGMLGNVARDELEDALHFFASQQVAPGDVETSRIRPIGRTRRGR